MTVALLISVFNEQEFIIDKFVSIDYYNFITISRKKKHWFHTISSCAQVKVARFFEKLIVMPVFYVLPKWIEKQK